MSTPLRLGLFAAALAVAFAAAFGLGSIAGVPAPAADAATGEHGGEPGGHPSGAEEPATETGAHAAEHDGGGQSEPAAAPAGLQVSAGGYTLADVTAPQEPGAQGDLTLRILGPDGAPVTHFQTQHEMPLHLIVVSADGVWFEHVHPELAADGTWSVPWQWPAAGAYRVYADFLPAGVQDGLTLTSSIQVPGEVSAQPLPTPARTDGTDGYQVSLHGELSTTAGQLTFTVTRDGEPVELEPYLGASGHLVALRMGDLAYLHVHPEEGAAGTGTAAFTATAPSPGTYRLFLDFQTDGQVHTADFTVTIEES